MRILKYVALAVVLFSSALAQFKMDPHLYDPDADAKAEIARALKQAGQEHKRVLIVFGANWCPDCHALNYRFHQQPIESLVEKNFVVVHVDIGEGEGRYAKNTDLAEKYKVPIKKGIPALAVLSSTGKLLYSQQNGEFEAARSLDPQKIIDFLNQWKPPSKA